MNAVVDIKMFEKPRLLNRFWNILTTQRKDKIPQERAKWQQHSIIQDVFVRYGAYFS